MNPTSGGRGDASKSSEELGTRVLLASRDIRPLPRLGPLIPRLIGDVVGNAFSPIPHLALAPP